MILPYFSWVTNGVPKDSGQGVSGCNSNEFAVSRVCIFWHVQRCLKNLDDHEDPKTGQPLSFFSCSVTCSVAYFLAELVGRFCRTFRYLAVERISSKMFGVGFPFLQGPFVFFGVDFPINRLMLRRKKLNRKLGWRLTSWKLLPIGCFKRFHPAR